MVCPTKATSPAGPIDMSHGHITAHQPESSTDLLHLHNRLPALLIHSCSRTPHSTGSQKTHFTMFSLVFRRGMATKAPSALGKAWAIDLIKDAASVTGKQAEASYKALLEGVQVAVAKGERVTFQGFGTFEKTSRAARNGVNPQTGAAIQIPATEAPKFKAGTAFKQMVKGK